MQWDLQRLKCLDSSSSPFTVPFLGMPAFSGKFWFTSQQRRKDGIKKSIPQPSISQFGRRSLGRGNTARRSLLGEPVGTFFSVSDSLKGNLNLILPASLPPCISIYQRKIWKNSGEHPLLFGCCKAVRQRVLFDLFFSSFFHWGVGSGNHLVGRVLSPDSTSFKQWNIVNTPDQVASEASTAAMSFCRFWKNIYSPDYASKVSYPQEVSILFQMLLVATIDNMLHVAFPCAKNSVFFRGKSTWYGDRSFARIPMAMTIAIFCQSNLDWGGASQNIHIKIALKIHIFSKASGKAFNKSLTTCC